MVCKLLVYNIISSAVESPARMIKKPRAVSAKAQQSHSASPDVRASAPRRALSFDLSGWFIALKLWNQIAPSFVAS